ncbi:AraC family transcriptional regulator [Chitinophaga sp.]|uniref:helix-turn-helix transcriptional regulator n=1 Tax=Chitinophaga sp. TaxID=1869181 RepID=UPI0031E07030
MSNTLPVSIPDYFYYYPKSNELGTVVENRSSAVHEGKQEVVHELHSSDGIYMWYSRVHLRSAKKMVVEYPAPFVHISYVLQGSSVYRNGDEKTPFTAFHSLQYNVLLLPAGKVHVEWMPGKEVENFEINISREFFEKHLPAGHPFLAQARQTGTHALASALHLPVTPQIRSIIYDIVNCNMDPAHKRLYMKAKTLELMALQMQQQKNLPEETFLQPGDIKMSDAQKMHAAREIILQRLDNPYTIPALAHLVGTNENYLKKNFKKVFGTTVFGFIQQLRMERARDILINEKKKIGEVARLTGYSHISHFSKAFKKQFGFSPKNIRVGVCLWLADLQAAFFSELSLLPAV